MRRAHQYHCGRFHGRAFTCPRGRWLRVRVAGLHTNEYINNNSQPTSRTSNDDGDDDEAGAANKHVARNNSERADTVASSIINRFAQAAKHTTIHYLLLARLARVRALARSLKRADASNR